MNRKLMENLLLQVDCSYEAHLDHGLMIMRRVDKKVTLELGVRKKNSIMPSLYHPTP